MSLDLSRLENVRQRGDKTVARCPACAEENRDTKGEHLVIYQDGRFGCVANPGAAGKSHRQRIFALAGEPHCRSRGACMVRVRRPAASNLQQVAGLLDGIGRFGRVALTYARTREHNPVQTGGEHEDMLTHTREGGKNPSNPSNAVQPETRQADEASRPAVSFVRAPSAKPSQTIPPPTRETPPPECGDPLMAKALATFNGHRQADTAAQDIDPETGYPIIGGAICPF